MTTQAAATADQVAVEAEATINLLSSEKTCGVLRKSFLILTCKMSENGVQLASTFVLVKPCFFKVYPKREILYDRFKFLSWTRVRSP